MRQSHLILSNAAVMWVARILLLFPQLILVPYLIGTIGESGYGVYALVWSLMVSIDQMEKSLQSGVVKYSAAFLAKKQISEVNKVVSSSFVYSAILAALACTSIIVVSRFYDDPTGTMASSLVVVGVTTLLVIPLTPYVGIIKSRQRYYIGAIAETVCKYLSLLFVIVWYKMVNPSVESAVIIMSAMFLLSRLAQVPFAYRLVPGLHNRAGTFDWQSFRLIASFGIVTVFIALSLAANNTGVKWMMGILVSPVFVAHLSIILMPVMLLSQLVNAMTITVMPATSAYEATGNQRMLKELLIRGTRYTTILMLAGILVAGLLMRNVLTLWVGPEYEFLAPFALVIFASRSFMLSTSTGHHMLKGMGRLRAAVFISLTGHVVVPITLILIVFQICRNPYIAITFGFASGHVIYGLLQTGFGIKAVNTDWREFLMRVYGQPLIVAAVIFPIALGLVAYGEIHGLFGRILVSVLSVLLLFLGSYLFIASVAERKQFKETVKIVLGRVSAMSGKITQNTKE